MDSAAYFRRPCERGRELIVRQATHHFSISHYLALALAALSCMTSVPGLAEEQSSRPRLVPAQRSYVPLSELQVLVERDRRGVLLPRAQFEKLVADAQANATATGTAPIGHVLKDCNYAATIVGDQLLLDVTAELEQLAPAVQIWKFPLKRVAVEQATLDDQPALIGRTRDGELTVVTQSRGTHRLKLLLSTELVTVGSDKAAIFSLLAGSAGKFTLTVDAGKRLLVDNAELERPAPIDQPAHYTIAVGGKTQLPLRITDRASDQRADVLTFATSGYGLVVAPGEVTWHVLTTLQVYGRPVDRVTLSVPGYLEIADVESTGLERWELQDDPANPERTQISLAYGQPFDGSRQVTVRGVMAVSSDVAWSVPPLIVENANSHVGQVVVQHPAGVRLQVVEAEGVRRATESQRPVSDMPEDMPTTGEGQRLRFDVWREDFVLRLKAAPKERELHTAVASLLNIASTDISLQAAFTLSPRNAPLFDLDVDIPADWTVIAAATGTDQPLSWRTLPQQPGINRVRVPLPAALAPGAMSVVRLSLRRELEGWPVEETPVVLALPELIVPQSSVVETALVIRGDADLELTPQDVIGLDVIELKADWERARFQSQDTRYSGQLKIARRRAQTAVETMAYQRLDRQTLSATLLANLSIEGGGLRDIVLSLPEAVPAAQQFAAQGGTLIEQTAVGVVGGRRLWRLRFAERVLGVLELRADITLPRGTDQNQPTVGPLLEFPNVDRSYGVVVIEAGPDQKLTVAASDARGQALSEIDPLDIPPADYQPAERIVAVYRTIGDGNAITLQEERFEKGAIPTAVCTRLAVLTVVSPAGELQQRAEFELRMAGVQQLQVELPESTELWSATLGEHPVEIRRAQGRLLISVPGEIFGDVETTLRLDYRATTTALHSRGTLFETPPLVSVIAGQGTPQPIDVLEQEWNLVHPRDTLVVDYAGALEPTSALDQPGWMLQLGSLVQTPSPEDLLWTSILLAILAGVVALVLMVAQQKLVVKLGIVAVMGFLGLCLVSVMFVPVSCSSRMGLVSQSSRGVMPGKDLYFDHLAIHTGNVDAPEAMPQAPMADFDVQVHESFTMEIGEKQDKKSGAAPAAPPARATNQAQEAPMPTAAPALAAPAEDKPFAEQRMEREVVQQQVINGIAGDIAPIEQKLSLQIRQSQALLSLALDLERPADSVEKSFRYVGASGQGSGVPLQVEYVNRRGGASFRGFLFACGILLGWWLRRTSFSMKAAFIISGLLVGLGLLPVLPVTWQTALDGLFFAILGLCSAWVLWGLGRACVACCDLWNRCCQTLLTAVLFVTCCSSSAFAQPVNPQPNTAPQKALVPEPPPFPASQWLVYDDPKSPLAAERVFVPYQKFLELYRLAHPDKVAPPTAPITAKLLSALYAARVTPSVAGADTSLVVNARLTLQSAVDGQQAVALPLQGVILKSAQLNGATAALVTDAAPWKVLLPQPGLHVLDLEFLVPVQGNTTAGSMLLKLDATPAARFSFTLPDPNHSLRVNGSTSIYRRVTKDDVSLIEFPVDAGGELQLSWQPEQARGGAAVVHAESATGVSVTDAGVSASVGFTYRVRQGIVRDISFLLPEGFQLQSVSGPDVGGWELVGAPPVRKLRVFLRRNVDDSTQLTLDGYLGQRVDQELAFRVPEIVPQEITTEVGTVSIYATEAFSTRAESVSSLNQIDAAKFEPAVPISRAVAQPQLAYRFSQRPWSLQLRAARLSTRLEAQVLQGVRLAHRKQLVTVRALCELSRMPRSSLVFQVPSSWLILDVQAEGLSDWYPTPQDDRTALTLDFATPQVGLVVVDITATLARSADSSSVAIESPQLAGAEKQTSQIALWLDAGESGGIQNPGNWTSLDPTAIAADLKRLQPTPAQFAFSTQSVTPAPIALQITRRAPQFESTSLTVMTVTDVAVVYGCVFQWQIAQAATDLLTVEVPTWLSSRLQFHGNEIRETVATAVDDQTTRWAISLRGPVSGEFKLAATAALPPAETLVRAPAVRFVTTAAGVATPVDPQKHFVLLINTSLSQLTSVEPARVEPVQRDDVKLVIRQELIDQATEFIRVLRTGAAPEWKLERYLQTPGLPAAVNLADQMTIVSRDGSYRGVVTYSVKNRTRQFLAVRLPEGSRLLSVFVGDQPSRTVVTNIANRPAHLIALPKTSAVDLSFPVQVVYAGQLAKPLPVRSSLLPAEIDLPTAEVVRSDESAEFGVPVARTQWTVYFPDDLHATPVRDQQRHNLNVAREAALRESSISVLLNDADEVLSALGSVNNYYGKERALGNLKQLDHAISGYATELNGEEFRRKSEKLKRSVSELERQLDEANNLGLDRRQIPNPVEMLESDADLLNGRIQGGDAHIQFGRALANNGAIIVDNRNSLSLGVSSGPTLNFNFSLVSPVASPNRPGTAKALADQAAKRSESSTLEARQRYQQFNEDQLRSLQDGLDRRELSSNAAAAPQSRRAAESGKESVERQFRVVAPKSQSDASDRFGGRGAIGDRDGDGVPESAAAAGRKREPADPFATEVEQEFRLRFQAEPKAFGGGMGGGMGGIGGVGGDLGEGADLYGMTGSGWTQAGGLSVPFEIPTAGHKLVFTKTGGDARLAVRLQTVQSVQQAFGIVWAAACLIGAGFCLVWFFRSAGRPRILPWMPYAVVMVSAVGALFLAQPLSFLCILAFLAGMIWLLATREARI